MRKSIQEDQLAPDVLALVGGAADYDLFQPGTGDRLLEPPGKPAMCIRAVRAVLFLVVEAVLYYIVEKNERHPHFFGKESDPIFMLAIIIVEEQRTSDRIH